MDKRIEKENKRLWLSIEIDKKSTESLLVILKNPSRATKEVADKTVFTVTKYIYTNRERYPFLNNIGTIIILNLIPFYQTYAELLKKEGLKIIDQQNIDTIIDFTSKHKKVIVAWGDHPRGLKNEYDDLRQEVLNILKPINNEVFYVDKLSKSGNPKHGQVWGYKNELLKFEF